MKRCTFLLFFILMMVTMQAQFVNNGATVTVQSGATLRVETDIQNLGAGTITNNGTIEVSGNFTNASTANITAGAGLVKFISTVGSPTNATLDTGTDALPNVEMAKTSNHTVTLAGPATISGNLTFTGAGSKLKLGNYDLTLAATSAVTATTDHPTNGYVVTDGTGKMVKGITANNAAFLLPIGDGTAYTPVSSNITGSAYTAATIGARVYTNSLQTKYSDATDYIAREWNVVQNGGISTYKNVMTGTYVAGDATGTQSLIKGTTYLPSDWHFDDSNNGALQVIASSTASDVKLSGQNFFGKANLKVFLAGALSGTTMTTTLRNNNLIPLTTPYTAAPFSAPSVTATSIPSNVTDWILVEVRDPSTPSTVISKTSAFLLNDGNIINIDGSPLRLKNAVASGHIALKHRNHLGIRTANALDLLNPPGLKNFSLGTSEAYTNGTITSNANMKLVGSIYAMWDGDLNNDGFVRYTDIFDFDTFTSIESDGLSVYNFLGSGNAQYNGYSKYDLNYDGHVRYTDIFDFGTFTTIESDALAVYNILQSGTAQLKSHN